MMKYLRAISLLFAFFLTSNVSAQDQTKAWEKEQEAAIKRWKDQMQEDRMLIRKYLKSDLFKNFDKEIEDVLKSFNPDTFKNFFDDDQFDKFLDKANPAAGLAEGSHRWIETPKHKILILKMKLKENTPFDIKIENNHIIVKGTIVEQKEEKTDTGTNFYKSTQSVTKSFPVPNDVNAEQVEFENKMGEILIKLPKRKVSDLYNKDKKTPKTKSKPKVRPGLRDITPSEGDITI